MRIRRYAWGRAARYQCWLAVLSAMLLVACGDDEQSPGGDEVGSAEIAITAAPEGVQCIRVTAVGSRTVESTFAVQSGQNTRFHLGGLPLGDVQFYAGAFEQECDAGLAGRAPRWVGGPETAEIQVNRPAFVTLVMRSNGQGQVTLDFEMDPDTGAPCVDANRPECLDPSDATGAPGTPPPAAATMISPAEFGSMLNSGLLQLGSQRLEEQRSDQEAQQLETDIQFLKTALANQPELLAWVMAEAQETDQLQHLPDGNYALEIATGPNAVQTVVTHGPAFKIGEVAQSLREFPTQTNQFGIYEEVYDAVPADLRGQFQLVNPEQLVNASADELLSINQQLVADIADLGPLLPVPGGPPVGYPEECSEEEGTPVPATDQTGAFCEPSPGGVWDTTGFPLKWHATCVKNQAARGTCVSFGITAAVESAFSLANNRWLNLSEERLYYWATVPRAFGDGLGTQHTMVRMVGESFDFPWEFSWDYNPSRSRVAVKDIPGYYFNSCVGYGGEHCSDTTHQGDSVCSDILGFRFCGWLGSATPSTGIELTNTLQLFSFGKAGGSGLGRLFLSLGKPLVMSFAVTPTFDGAGADGTVAYLGDLEDDRGGHAVAVLGHVDNEDLADGIPPGVGGGYFILKNSWGSCFADGGYVYLPYAWVDTYAYGLMMVTDIN